MKEPHDFLGFLVQSGDVWSFEGIAMQTAVGKILRNGRSTMLLRYDMIDLEG
jgi:hypothetical protein